jgi:hypothetical protein
MAGALNQIGWARKLQQEILSAERVLPLLRQVGKAWL